MTRDAPQNPRPEGDWTFRRALVFGGRLIALAILVLIVWLAPDAAMQPIALGLIALMALESTFYLIAPSATELIRLVAELRPGVRLGGREPPQ